MVDPGSRGLFGIFDFRDGSADFYPKFENGAIKKKEVTSSSDGRVEKECQHSPGL